MTEFDHERSMAQPRRPADASIFQALRFTDPMRPLHSSADMEANTGRPLEDWLDEELRGEFFGLLRAESYVSSIQNARRVSLLYQSLKLWPRLIYKISLVTLPSEVFNIVK